jgi:putative DNA methylase
LSYPKRLIEVNLPIKRISAHARREKSIRHGHISTLHIWWARRPLAACRAVICAALWPDPADTLCPQPFVQAARNEMLSWTSHERQRLLSEDSRSRFEAARKDSQHFDNPEELRYALLDFIADFSNWDHSSIQEYLDTSRTLTRAAHEALGGASCTRPLVVDPFAGGGSIPLEALRVGADAFASDLNPVAVLLNKVVLEYIPKCGQHLADELRKWGEWIKREAEKELAEFYPRDPDGATPIAYLWARTIQCEGPGCGAEVPLIRSLWLAKKAHRSAGLQLLPNPKAKRVDFQVIIKDRAGWVDQASPKARIDNPKFDGTVKRGSGTCPCCGYTTPVKQIREQLKARRGGANDARLICVVTTQATEIGRSYRLATPQDIKAVCNAVERLKTRRESHGGPLSLVPNEPLPPQGSLGFRVQPYGMTEWSHLFTDRQLLAVTTIGWLIQRAGELARAKGDSNNANAIQTCLALALSRLADRTSTLCTWRPQADQEKIEHVFSRQALPMTWDFAEGTFLSERTAGWNDAYQPPARIIDAFSTLGLHEGSVSAASATAHPLPDCSANLFASDPPYYDAVPYSDLSDFFFVWLKRSLPQADVGAFSSSVTPKERECIVDEARGKGRDYFEATMKQAMAEGRRVLSRSGIGIIVFAHKSTAGWEAQLQAMIDAGWIVTGSWPIDTEMGTRLRAMDSAALASSIHLVCRPRNNPDVLAQAEEVGDWRDVLQELPQRIHEWMPRLAAEGVVGADAIFACLGPALEIFSRYSRVEKTSGNVVTLKEYLEQVWAAVAKEALSMVFEGADASGFEPDARLTAIWLWTLNAGKGDSANDDNDDEEELDDESEGSAKKVKATGFILEYDAARKIAQGLGAHLENLSSLVEVSGEEARLLPVAERAHYLFGQDEGKTVAMPKKKPKAQMDLFKVLEDAESNAPTFGEAKVGRSGETVLDRIHQSMILFAAGRGEALKRLLVDAEVGIDPRFWRLAQALAALYPKGSDERRWVEGVLARKKGLGL